MTFAMKLEETRRAGQADIILKLAQKLPVEEIAAMLEESVDYIQKVISSHQN